MLRTGSRQPDPPIEIASPRHQRLSGDRIQNIRVPPGFRCVSSHHHHQVTGHCEAPPEALRDVRAQVVALRLQARILALTSALSDLRTSAIVSVSNEPFRYGMMAKNASDRCSSDFSERMSATTVGIAHRQTRSERNESLDPAGRFYLLCGVCYVSRRSRPLGVAEFERRAPR